VFNFKKNGKENEKPTGRKEKKTIKGDLLCKGLSPVFTVIFYASIVLAALLLVTMLIIFLMNTSVEKMLLPPFMHRVTDDSGELVSYMIYLGNGVKVKCDASLVTAQDIKTVLYAGIFTVICVLCVIAPAAKFLGTLSKNVGKGDVFNERNPRLVLFVGLTVLIGNPFVLFIMRFYNYQLLNTFMKSAEESIELALGFDFYSMIFGAMILLFGVIYGHTVKAAKNGAVPADNVSAVITKN